MGTVNSIPLLIETPCVCVIPDGGDCPRHKVYKTPHWVHLCRTSPRYFASWERNIGPGQDLASRTVDAKFAGVIEKLQKKPCSPCAKKRRKPMQTQFPSLHTQAWNLARSLGDFIADGMRTVTAEQYEERLLICDSCEMRRGNRCLVCGCRLSLKARGRAFKCPKDNWPEVT